MKSLSNPDTVVRNQTDYSYIIIGLVTFVGDSARGILFPALRPLCQKLGGTKIDLGYLVSIFSVGRLLISTRLGIISDKYRHREALLLSGAILILGSLIWSNSVFLGGLPMLYVAQITLGLGTGSLGVTRSYVVEQATPEKRTYRLARLSALQYAGFAATPLLGSLLVVMGSKISDYWMYALPAYLLFLLAVLCFIVLYYIFKDVDETGDEMQEQAQHKLLLSSTRKINTCYMKNDLKNKQVFYVPIKNGDEDDHTTFLESKSLSSDSLIMHDTSPLNKTFKKTIEKSLLYNNEKKSIDTGSNNEVINYPSNNILSSTFSVLHCTNNLNHTHKAVYQSENKNKIGTSPSTNNIDKKYQNENDVENKNDLEKTFSKEEEQKFETENMLTTSENHALNQVFYLMMIFLNFTTRGVIATYESQASTILLGFYHITQLQLGFIVTISGIVGTLQLLFFKQFWTKHFSDMTLMIGGFFLIGAAAVLIVDFGPVLGSFSMLQKAGRQAKAQSQFAFMGSLARVIFPVLSGYLEQYIDQKSSFAFNLLVVSLSMMGVMFFYDKILFFTVNDINGTNNNNNNNNNAALTLKTFSIYKMNQLQWSVLIICFLASVASVGAMCNWGGIYHY